MPRTDGSEISAPHSAGEGCAANYQDVGVNNLFSIIKNNEKIIEEILLCLMIYYSFLNQNAVHTLKYIYSNIIYS